ncbi:carboxypeptidase-like regulatory domain-containing protein, partial [Sinomicrobium sp. FJxs]|nr:carboxypeptidase-like regulatory domain-containing protein [Sinomicrobium weinanense]
MAQEGNIPDNVRVRLKPGSLRSVLEQVQQQTSYSFAYNNEEIDRVSDAGIKQGEYSLADLLKTLKQKYQLNFKNRNGVIYVKRKKSGTLRSIKGRVLDESGGPLPQANVLEKGTSNGVVTDMNGNFNIRISAEDAVLAVSYLGYLSREIRPGNKTAINVDLEPDAALLDEVVVTDRRNIAEIKKPQMSVNRLSAEQIRKIPAVLGETDPLKSLLQLPGVTNAGEASSGFNVRGGAADQNLILLDGSPIFSDSHLFGFFSVFNADAISDMELYKGGIPSTFGG